jgi:hypothetical protein
MTTTTTTGAWTPPSWLPDASASNVGGNSGNSGAAVAGGGGGGGIRGSRPFRQYALEIPPVPGPVREAVAAALTAGGGGNGGGSGGRVRLLHGRVVDQRERVAAQEGRLAALETAKEEGLRDIRLRREREKRDGAAALERKIRGRHARELDRRRAQFEAELEEECAARRKRLREEQRQQSEAAAAAAAEKEKESPEKKTEDDMDISEEGEIVVAAPAPPPPTAAAAEAEPPRSVQLRQEADEMGAKLDGLNEDRQEMVWLLKQVIKAEEKQKARIEKEKKKKTVETKVAPSNR